MKILAGEETRSCQNMSKSPTTSTFGPSFTKPNENTSTRQAAARRIATWFTRVHSCAEVSCIDFGEGKEMFIESIRLGRSNAKDRGGVSSLVVSQSHVSLGHDLAVFH